MVNIAKNEARYYGHPSLIGLHFVAALLKKGNNVAAQTLFANNIDLDKVRDRIRKIPGAGEKLDPLQLIFLSKTFEVALVNAQSLAIIMDDGVISPVHIFAGLLQCEDEYLLKMLASLNVHRAGDLYHHLTMNHRLEKESARGRALLAAFLAGSEATGLGQNRVAKNMENVDPMARQLMDEWFMVSEGNEIKRLIAHVGSKNP